MHCFDQEATQTHAFYREEEEEEVWMNWPRIGL
jgi:hypothetical protein